jgi:hypothetical protein
MNRSRIQAVEHVTIEAPLGVDADLRWFYGEVADLPEIEPRGEGGPSFCFKSARIELRIMLLADPHIETGSYRLTLMVPSLEIAAERLDEHRVEWDRFWGLNWADQRLGTTDPAGNRVWLKREWPFAPL